MSKEAYTEITLDHPVAECGSEVSGTVSWSGPKEPRSVWVKLRYRTEGRGSTNRDEVVEMSVPAGRSGQHRFSLRVPHEGPISYDGNLVSVIWEVNLKLDLPKRRDVHEVERFTVFPATA